MAVPGEPNYGWCCDDPELMAGCGLANPEGHEYCECENCGAIWPHLIRQPHWHAEVKDIPEGSELEEVDFITYEPWDWVRPEEYFLTTAASGP